MLKFNVNHQTITRTDAFKVVADSKNYLTSEFSFSEEWAGIITALFSDGKNTYLQIIENNQCLIPWEVIRAPYFTVSVFCGDLITTNIISVPVEKSGYSQGKEPQEPTPDIYEQLVGLSEEARQLAQSVRDDADNGVFDGEKGEQGIPGRTPQRGTDYWTDADKAEIKQYVEDAILGGAW